MGRCEDVRMGWEEGRIMFSWCGPDLFSSYMYLLEKYRKKDPAENIHILLLKTYMCTFYIIHTVIQLMLLYSLWLPDVKSKYKFRLLNKSELKFLISCFIM
jgi:hypothetical protein